MQTSRSTPRSVEPVGRSPLVWPLVIVVVLALATVGVAALPAAWIARFIPDPRLHLEDFSGTLWHGSAGRILVNARPAGAIEWHVHPWALLTLNLSADVQWVKGGFVLDALIEANRHLLTVRQLRGGGALEDLNDLGVPSAWHGASSIDFSEIRFDVAGSFANSRSIRLVGAVGRLTVSDLSSPQIAEGVDLGGYRLQVADAVITPDVAPTAELTDTGGPLQVNAVIHYSPGDNSGVVSGTMRERPNAPPALVKQLASIASAQPRDAQGRIPVELEFAM